MKNILYAGLAFTFLSYANPVIGQINNLSNDISGTPIKFSKKKDIDGSPLLFENWIPGEVILKDGKHVLDLPLKYNVEEDKVYYRLDDKTYVLDNWTINGFIMSPRDFEDPLEFANGFDNVEGFTKLDFFQVIHDGKTKFIKKTVRRIKERQNTGYGSVDASKYYAEIVSYFLYKEDGSSYPVKLSKSSFLKAMDDKAPAMKKAIKENNIKFSEMSSIKNLISIYDSK